jgi:hypothetical protein
MQKNNLRSAAPLVGLQREKKWFIACPALACDFTTRIAPPAHTKHSEEQNRAKRQSGLFVTTRRQNDEGRELAAFVSGSLLEFSFR